MLKHAIPGRWQGPRPACECRKANGFRCYWHWTCGTGELVEYVDDPPEGKTRVLRVTPWCARTIASPYDW
jgi:hypothetical protein